MNKTITILPNKEIRVVKKIAIVAQNVSNIPIRIGFIIYERECSFDYKLVERKMDSKGFLYLSTYTKQEDYPSDEIDELLSASIKNTFSNPSIHNEFLFSSFDAENLNLLTERPKEDVNFIFINQFYGQEMALLVGKSFKPFVRNGNVYVDSCSELLEHLTFSGNCKFENYQVL